MIKKYTNDDLIKKLKYIFKKIYIIEREEMKEDNRK